MLYQTATFRAAVPLRYRKRARRAVSILDAHQRNLEVLVPNRPLRYLVRYCTVFRLHYGRPWFLCAYSAVQNPIHFPSTRRPHLLGAFEHLDGAVAKATVAFQRIQRRSGEQRISVDLRGPKHDASFAQKKLLKKPGRLFMCIKVQKYKLLHRVVGPSQRRARDSFKP